MGQIRIIGGRWKRTLVSVADRPGLRPTPDRVRETLFNWLGQNLQGWACLDLFAGTGILGLEAGSRGASMVVFVERDPAACAAIAALIQKLKAGQQMQVVRADAMRWLAAEPTGGPKGAVGPFDLILMDPPFGQDLVDQALPLALHCLAPQGLIYLEAEKPISQDLAQSLGLEVVRADSAGMVHYHLLRRQDKQGETDADSGIPRNV
jgi:16S rRNA (guanine966-N2)-methyltransferase